MHNRGMPPPEARQRGDASRSGHDRAADPYVRLRAVRAGLRYKPRPRRNLPASSAASKRESAGEELIAQIRPRMNLCSRDYRKWGEVDAVLRPPVGSPYEVIVSGRRLDTGDPVYVPAHAVLTIEGGHCVRVDAPVAARLPEHVLTGTTLAGLSDRRLRARVDL